MRVLYEHPPNWEDIVAHFPHATKRGVFFCYGDTIYSPSGVQPANDIHVHEAVHQRQQGNDPEAWWDEYIVSPEFRLSQEVEAYRAQLRFIAAIYGRALRRKAQRDIASHLASPLYGALVSKSKALELLA